MTLQIATEKYYFNGVQRKKQKFTKLPDLFIMFHEFHLASL